MNGAVAESELAPERVTTESEAECRRLFPRVFAKLLDADVSQAFLQRWTSFLRVDTRNWSIRSEWLIDSGLITTMLKVSELRTAAARLAPSYALDILANLPRMTTDWSKATSWMLEAHRLGCIPVLLRGMKSNLFSVRSSAVNTLRVLCRELSMADHLSAAELAEIMFEALELLHKGEQPMLDELQDPQKDYQRDVMRPNIMLHEAIRFAPRWWGMIQENAVWLAHGCLCRGKRPTRRECLAILRCRPELIDLLLRTALLERTRCYPENESDSIAMEVLVQFVMLPWGYVPGLGFGGSDEEGVAELKDEWDAALDCMKIFVASEYWRDKLLQVWDKVDEESVGTIRRKFARSVASHHAPAAAHPDEYLSTIQGRGFLRITVLRIFLDLTYLSAKDPTLLPAATFLQAVRLGYKASFKVPSAEEAADDLEQRVVRVECTSEICRSPSPTATFPVKKGVTHAVAPQSIVGPAVIFRVLALLAEQGGHTIERIQSWNALPDRAAADVWHRQEVKQLLKHIKQITSPEVLRKVVFLAARQRLPKRRELGNERFRSSTDTDWARWTYLSAAELAASIVALADSPSDCAPAKEAREETDVDLAKSLGNAAEACSKLQQWKLSAWLAARAREHGATERELQDKNMSRMRRALEQLRLVRMSN